MSVCVQKIDIFGNNHCFLNCIVNYNWPKKTSKKNAYSYSGHEEVKEVNQNMYKLFYPFWKSNLKTFFTWNFSLLLAPCNSCHLSMTDQKMLHPQRLHQNKLSFYQQVWIAIRLCIIHKHCYRYFHINHTYCVMFCLEITNPLVRVTPHNWNMHLASYTHTCVQWNTYL